MAEKKSGQPKDAPLEAEVGKEFGVSSVFPTSTWSSFAYGRYTGSGSIELVNSGEGVPLDELVGMRRKDAQTRALLRLFTLPILSCLKDGEWVKDPNATYEGGDEEAEFANQMFRLPPQAGGMTSPLSKVLRQTLLSAVEGFSVFEEVRQVPEVGPLKGKVTLRKLAHRAAKTIKFNVDETGGFDGVTQTVPRPGTANSRVHLKKEKVWYYAMLEEENPFYGRSIFEAAWYHYDIKTKLYFISNLAAQMAAVPGRVGTHPPGASQAQKTAFAAALSNFAFNSAMMVPEGWKVEPFNSNSGFDFLKLIQHHEHMQAKSVLMQFADDANRMVLIENATQDASADMYVQTLQAVMDEIAESWTIHLMPKYIDWNFGSGKYPVWRFGAITDEARGLIKELFSTMVTSSTLNSTPEFVREMEKKLSSTMGLDIDYKLIEEIEKKAQEAQQAQAALDMAAPVEAGAPAPGPGGPTTPSQAEAGAPTPATPPGPAPALAASYTDSVDQIVTLAQDLLMAQRSDDGEDA